MEIHSGLQKRAARRLPVFNADVSASVRLHVSFAD
jgi:hypothetical protein